MTFLSPYIIIGTSIQSRCQDEKWYILSNPENGSLGENTK
jgi:hypothetical protein